MWSLRLYSKLWGTLIGQAVYLQITDPDTPRIHTHTEKLMIPKTAGYGENCIQRFSTVIAVSQSLTAAGSARGWKSSLKRTITSGSLSAIYSIKISPWRSTDSQTGPWEREREKGQTKKEERNKANIYTVIHTKDEEKSLRTEGWSSAESQGKARAIPAFRSPKWTPLNLSCLVFYLSCEDQTLLSVK